MVRMKDYRGELGIFQYKVRLSVSLQYDDVLDNIQTPVHNIAEQACVELSLGFSEVITTCKIKITALLLRNVSLTQVLCSFFPKFNFLV